MSRVLSASLFAIMSLAAPQSARSVEAEVPQPPCRIAIVIDDGPVPGQAEKIHALLRREGIRVTFAHVGKNVQQHPEITRAAHAAGHEIVNHSFSHTRIGELDARQVDAEVTRGKEAIAAAIGRSPRWYWPPFLEADDRLLASIERAGLERFVPHRLVDSHDWDRATPADEIRRRATEDVRDGDVILCHEWREETLQQLPAILAELRQQRCVFLTFSELAAELKRRPPKETPR